MGELDKEYIGAGPMATGVRMAKTPAKPPDFRTRTRESKAYSGRARRWMPGGVTANVKYFDPYPVAMKRAKGCRLWDLDGNEYVDYCLSFGPLILGHGHPRVMKAIQNSLLSAGTTMFGTPHELEAAYAEYLLEIFRPNGKIRFTVSGTEATIHAVRIARAYRKRPMIAKFQGHYHGGVDEFLVSHAPPERESKDLVPVSGSTGTPEHVLKNTLVLPFNDLPTAESQIRSHAEGLSCVILEPVERSFIEPDREFLKGLREITTKYDIPLIFDEVMSGFRTSFGGAQHTYGVTPDLTCLGKVIGGGLPCGAFLGREDILDLADPSADRFFHSSTFAGYPTAMAAGLATLDELRRDGVMSKLLTTSGRTMSEIEETIRDSHVSAQVLGCGSVFSVLFTAAPIRNYLDTLAADQESRRKLDFTLLERGVFVKPEKPFYLSTVHDREALTHTLRAFDEILPTMA